MQIEYAHNLSCATYALYVAELLAEMEILICLPRKSYRRFCILVAYAYYAEPRVCAILFVNSQ